METNRSACCARARRIRSRRGTKRIAVASEHGLHAGFGIDFQRQFLGDGQHHILLSGAVLADGAGILAAMAGIHRDDEVARVGGRMLDFHRRIHALTGAQVDDQSVAVSVIGRRQKTLRLNGPAQVEHDAQLSRRPARHAHPLHRRRSRRGRYARRRLGVHPLTSSTTRSGFLRTCKLCWALPDRSNTTRVPSGPAQNRTPRTSTACAGSSAVNSSDSPTPSARY